MGFGYATLRYGIEIRNGGHSFKTGDWLLNYDGGPIRRGLMGAILVKISDLGIPLLWVTFFVQITIMAILFALVLKLYHSQPRGSFWLLVIFSPVFLLFSFYDLNGGFRKEILVLAIFAFYCLIFASGTVTGASLALIAALFALAAFSHELTILTLPTFLYMSLRTQEEGFISRLTAVRFASVLLIISAAAVAFSATFRVDAAASDAICRSLIERGLDGKMCDGALAWSTDNLATSIERVRGMIGYGSLSIIGLAILSLLPLHFTTFVTRRTVSVLFTVILSFSPLFVVAIDWGRWLHVIIFMIFCISLSENVSVNGPFKRSHLVFGAVYLSSWHVPHCCVGGGSNFNYGESIGYGLVGRFVQSVGSVWSSLL